MLDEQCSVYASAKDRIGIGQMSIRDFLFSGRWKEPVLRLRRLVAEYGALEAKRRDDYRLMKQRLPGATLSGLFSRRRGDCLVRHTGYIALDIDLADNATVGDFNNIAYVLKHRPEVACFLRSCSGTGYFALARLAYPDKHKEQFAALREEYGAMGVQLDKACSDITRIRFATYDEEPFVNERVQPYAELHEAQSSLVRRGRVYHSTQPVTVGSSGDFVEKLVSAMERDHIEVPFDYNVWLKIGFSFVSLGALGRTLFHRVLRLCPKYNFDVADKKYNDCLKVRSVSVSSFIALVGNIYQSGCFDFAPLRFSSDYERRVFWAKVIEGNR